MTNDIYKYGNHADMVQRGSLKQKFHKDKHKSNRKKKVSFLTCAMIEETEKIATRKQDGVQSNSHVNSDKQGVSGSRIIRCSVSSDQMDDIIKTDKMDEDGKSDKKIVGNDDGMKDSGNDRMKDSGNDKMKDSGNDKMKDSGNDRMKDSRNDKMKDSRNDKMKDSRKDRMKDSGQDKVKDAVQSVKKTPTMHDDKQTQNGPLNTSLRLPGEREHTKKDDIPVEISPEQSEILQEMNRQKVEISKLLQITEETNKERMEFFQNSNHHEILQRDKEGGLSSLLREKMDNFNLNFLQSFEENKRRVQLKMEGSLQKLHNALVQFKSLKDLIRKFDSKEQIIQKLLEEQEKMKKTIQGLYDNVHKLIHEESQLSESLELWKYTSQQKDHLLIQTLKREEARVASLKNLLSDRDQMIQEQWDTLKAMLQICRQCGYPADVADLCFNAIRGLYDKLKEPKFHFLRKKMDLTEEEKFLKEMKMGEIVRMMRSQFRFLNNAPKKTSDPKVDYAISKLLDVNNMHYKRFEKSQKTLYQQFQQVAVECQTDPVTIVAQKTEAVPGKVIEKELSEKEYQFQKIIEEKLKERHLKKRKKSTPRSLDFDWDENSDVYRRFQHAKTHSKANSCDIRYANRGVETQTRPTMVFHIPTQTPKEMLFDAQRNPTQTTEGECQADLPHISSDYRQEMSSLRDKHTKLLEKYRAAEKDIETQKNELEQLNQEFDELEQSHQSLLSEKENLLYQIQQNQTDKKQTNIMPLSQDGENKFVKGPLKQFTHHRGLQRSNSLSMIRHRSTDTKNKSSSLVNASNHTDGSLNNQSLDKFNRLDSQTTIQKMTDLDGTTSDPISIQRDDEADIYSCLQALRRMVDNPDFSDFSVDDVQNELRVIFPYFQIFKKVDRISMIQPKVSRGVLAVPVQRDECVGTIQSYLRSKMTTKSVQTHQITSEISVQTKETRVPRPIEYKGEDLGDRDFSEQISLVYTTIERIKELYRFDDKAASKSIEMHNDTIQKLIQRHRGLIIKVYHAQSSFLIAFDQLRQAIEFSGEFQLRLLRLHYPPEILRLSYCKKLKDGKGLVVSRGLRANISIITCNNSIIGKNPTPGGDQYLTKMINRLIHLNKYAKGGQVIITSRVYSQIKTSSLIMNDFYSRLILMELNELKKLGSLRSIIPTELKFRVDYLNQQEEDKMKVREEVEKKKKKRKKLTRDKNDKGLPKYVRNAVGKSADLIHTIDENMEQETYEDNVAGLLLNCKENLSILCQELALVYPVLLKKVESLFPKDNDLELRAKTNSDLLMRKDDPSLRGTMYFQLAKVSQTFINSYEKYQNPSLRNVQSACASRNKSLPLL